MTRNSVRDRRLIGREIQEKAFRGDRGKMKRQMKIVLDCVSLGGCRSSHDVAEELSSEFAFLLSQS